MNTPIGFPIFVDRPILRNTGHSIDGLAISQCMLDATVDPVRRSNVTLNRLRNSRPRKARARPFCDSHYLVVILFPTHTVLDYASGLASNGLQTTRLKKSLRQPNL
jgi:hypothetical protein